MQVEDFRAIWPLTAPLGSAGKWRACGWAVVQLDYDEEMGVFACDVWLDGGRIRCPAHHQEGGVDSLLMPSQ